MTRHGPNNAPQQTKAFDNRRARNQQQGPPVNVPTSQPTLTLKERYISSVSVPHAGRTNYNKKGFESNIRHGRESQFSSSQHQNGRVDNPRELNSNGMDSNPHSSSPNRGRGRGKSGTGGGWGGRGNSENRGRGKGYQGRNDDSRGRNDTRNDTSGNGLLATTPVGNDSDKEFEENVRDLSTSGASRLARFSNHTLEQASYDELKVARQKERRDLIARGLIDDPDNRSTLANAVEFVGTCMDMCPLFERAERSAQFNVDKWELNPQTGKTDKNFAVKKFHRPAAGADAPLPSDVRPPRVLVSTLDYLIKNFLNSDEQLKLTHGFLRDRTRSIRQDFTMQSYTGSETVACHEIIARLHIIALHKLADEPVAKFSAQQEMEQLQKVLTTLQQLYDDARDVGVLYPNEAEFRAYQLIIHLRDQDQERQAQRWAPKVFNSKQVQQALKFFMLAQRNNAEQVHMRVGNPESCMNFAGTIFRLVKSRLTSYLQACLLEFHFNDIRKTALKAMKNTYRVDTKMVFLKDIKKMLGYESEEFVLRDCRHYGLNVEQTEVDGTILWYLVIVKGGGSWNENAPALQVNLHSSIESKMGDRTIADICYGVKSGEGAAKLNRITGPFAPDSAIFGKPAVAALPTNPVNPVFGTLVPLNGTPIVPRAGMPAFATESRKQFLTTAPPGATQPDVFQKAARNTAKQIPNPFLNPSQPTQPIVSAFGPTSQASSTFKHKPPVSTFPGPLSPVADIFRPGAANKPSFATPSVSVPLLDSTKGSPSLLAQDPALHALQASFPLGSPKVASPQTVSGGFFQPKSSPTASHKQVPRPDIFKPSASASSSTSQSVFGQAPATTSDGLYQSSPGPFSLPPSSTKSSSFFPSNITSTSTRTSTPSGSIFESHTVQNSFPTNFFSTPIGTPGDYEEENENDAYSTHIPTTSGLFDRISTPPTQDLFPNSHIAFTPALSSPPPPAASAATTASNPPAAQQVFPSKKPLLSRAAAWDFANIIFDDIISGEAKKAIQEAVDEDQARIIDAIAAEKYAEQEKLVAKKIVLDVAADQFYTVHSGARVFYSWKKKARKLMWKKRAKERQQRELFPPPVQWRPVKIPEWVFDGPLDMIQQMNDMIYKSVPLLEIFQPKIEAALRSIGEGGRKWRLLMNSTNKADVNNYWWIEKMIGNNASRIFESKKGNFEAQFELKNVEREVRETGGFVFGCSADYSIPNEERFAQDKKKLHAAVDWLSERTDFAKLAVMVVCYRSPLDNDDADPFGRDMGRSSGSGRSARISAIRKALDLDVFKKNERVIPGDLVLIENLEDCDIEDSMRRLADLVLHTVNPKVAEMMTRAPSPGTLAKQDSVKRKRAAYQRSLAVGSPKPTKPPIEYIAPSTPGGENNPKRQRVRNIINNVGMQTPYFQLRSRGLHLDWDKFPVPGGGTLGDGVENPVAEEYILTTSPVTTTISVPISTPISTPERRASTQSKGHSPLDGLKKQLAELGDMLGDVHTLFDDNLADLKEMEVELKEAISQGW